MGFCPNCGHKFEQGNLFCENCGENLSEYLEQATEDLQSNEHTEPVNPPVHEAVETKAVLHDYQTTRAVTDNSHTIITQANSGEVNERTNDAHTVKSHAHQESISSEQYDHLTQSPLSSIKEQLNTTSTTHKTKRRLWPIAIGGVLLACIVTGTYVFYGDTIMRKLSNATTTMTDGPSDAAITEVITKAPEEISFVETTHTDNGSNITESQNNESELEQNTEVIQSPATVDAVRSLYNNVIANIGGNKAVYYQPLNYNNQLLDDSVIFAENADAKMSAASIIKLFILVAYEQQKHTGRISGDTMYFYNYNDMVPGTGVMYHNPRNYTYDEIAKLMIIESDNMGANVLVNAIGGMAVVNQAISSLGFQNSTMNRFLGDINNPNDNYVTASEVGRLLASIYRKNIISEEASTEMLNILSEQRDKQYLSANVGNNIKFYSKTGIIQPSTLNDTGIFETPKGAFVIVVLTNSGDNSSQKHAMNNFGLELVNLFNQ